MNVHNNHVRNYMYIHQNLTTLFEKYAVCKYLYVFAKLYIIIILLTQMKPEQETLNWVMIYVPLLRSSVLYVGNIAIGICVIFNRIHILICGSVKLLRIYHIKCL